MKKKNIKQSKDEDAAPSLKSTRSARKNSPLCTDPPSKWPEVVLNMFYEKLEVQNCNKKGHPYWISCPISQECPLEELCCHKPAGATTITVCHDKKQYNRPLYRMRLILRYWKQGILLDKADQASHLCPNNDKNRACCNPDHRTAESHEINKARQRCPGWIWIHDSKEDLGGYWYRTCQHGPPRCKVFTPKSSTTPQ